MCQTYCHRFGFLKETDETILCLVFNLSCPNIFTYHLGFLKGGHKPTLGSGSQWGKKEIFRHVSVRHLFDSSAKGHPYIYHLEVYVVYLHILAHIQVHTPLAVYMYHWSSKGKSRYSIITQNELYKKKKRGIKILVFPKLTYFGPIWRRFWIDPLEFKRLLNVSII